MSKKSGEEIERLLDAVRASKQAIDKMKIHPGKMGELWLIHHIVQKLDTVTRLEWERKADTLKDFPTFQEFLKFLEGSIRILEAVHATAPSSSIALSNTKSSQNASSSKHKQISVHSTSTLQNKHSGPRSCFLCKGTHTLYVCQKFQSMTQPQRFEFCKNERLCLNCLQNSHPLKNYPSNKRCIVCQGKHHTKLHYERINQQIDVITGDNTTTLAKSDLGDASSVHFSSQIISHNASMAKTVLLATAQVTLADSQGNKIIVRALIDPGAERSFITERVLTQLSPQVKRISLSVTGVGAGVSSIARKETMLILKSKEDKSFSLNLSALVLGELTRLLPKSELKQTDWPHLKGLTLADPSFFIPSRIDCILGGDIYPFILRDGILKGPVGAPVAQQTIFGWVLTGESQTECACHHSSVRIFHTHTEPSLTQLVEKFWEIEDLPPQKLLTPDEQYCEDYFVETTYRKVDGRFVVRLPFSKKPAFISSRDIAVACLIRSEKRLLKNPLLADLYHAFMHEYLELGHMEIVPSSQLSRGNYYLPHHAVFKRENPQKIRVVFNASQQAANRLSLNDVLLSGPKLQKEITADIIKMF